MAAGLLRKKAISEQCRFEARGEVVREWVERGRGGGGWVFGAVVILGEVAYRLLEYSGISMILIGKIVTWI